MVMKNAFKYYQKQKIWTYKNSKNLVNNVQDNSKRRIPVMASITNSNEKRPLFIIAVENSKDEKQNLIGELIEHNVFTYPSKLYMKTDFLIEYLQFIRKQFNQNTKKLV